LLGAGRSGTTLLATLLNSNPKIQTIGEMHQFANHLIDNKECSCGKKLSECDFWKKIIANINLDKNNLKRIQLINKQKEAHKNILFLLIKSKPDLEYLEFQDHVLEIIYNKCKGKILLDSSKYIARYLLLKKSAILNVKGIYVVRDVRGVVNSFQKQVQTPKAPLKTIMYYNLINFFAQILCTIDRKIIKVRYEDLMESPLPTLNKIYSHVFEENIKEDLLPDFFEMPHIIGGNRMKKKSSVKIVSDNQWETNISRFGQVIYYVLALPTMMLNKYKV